MASWLNLEPVWKRGTWVGGQLTSGACLGLAGPGLRQKRDRDAQGQQQGWETMAPGCRAFGLNSFMVSCLCCQQRSSECCPTAKTESFSKAFKSTIFWELMMTITNGAHLTGALRRLHGKHWCTLLGTALASSLPPPHHHIPSCERCLLP